MTHRQRQDLTQAIPMGDEAPFYQIAAGQNNFVYADLDPRCRLFVGVETQTAAIAHSHEPQVEQILVPAELRHHRDETMVYPAEAAFDFADAPRIYGPDMAIRFHARCLSQTRGNLPSRLTLQRAGNPGNSFCISTA
jgi:hypothetical protein